jgi:hypothetical protein
VREYAQLVSNPGMEILCLFLRQSFLILLWMDFTGVLPLSQVKSVISGVADHR